jgi:hypothetical protein
VTRTALTLTLFAALSLWASAQDRAPTLDRQLRQLHANRLLLDQLIDHGLHLSSGERGGTHLARAEECRQVANKLAAALRAVADERDPDPERVAELGDHIAAVVRDGLVPNLDGAVKDIHPGSELYDQLKKVSAQSSDDVADLVRSFPNGGRLDTSPKVAEAKSRLADAGGKITVVK